MQEVGCTGNGNEDTSKPSKQRNKMLNGISEKGLGKSHKVTVENCLGGRSNTVVKNLDQ